MVESAHPYEAKAQPGDPGDPDGAVQLSGDMALENSKLGQMAMGQY